MKIDLLFSDRKTEKNLKKSLIQLIREILMDPIFDCIPNNSYISVTIVDNEIIKELNKAYRNIDNPTDVLSFPIKEMLPNEYILGEIIISQEMVIENAKKYGLTSNIELLKLIIHSLLHLIDYDHKTPEEEKKMKYHEDRLMDLFIEKVKAIDLNKELLN
ncbi:MAG: rRNA maturation RNase YbeY [Caldisericia bacterium]|jgi:probable rRNA maturation factor|nr:rRNA maturation RNase YbeY [Caldisericia bacterium]MDD3427793.1 rRNA maturation RNase YbeY [Caldisericia bacterium]MDD5689115.1 rRNA maturation RNase YbeY [Caldisericia bacterium]HOJ15799.1 rRNA maturation RNase YbeY [Caldisericia bacterium]HOW02522.1 rRNA maturation RNase YbeY [Caldisericia bacterium]